jgi:checkpoint serine/threonine-protein kinase
MLVALADPPLTSLSHVRDLRPKKSERLESLQKTVKAKQRRASATSRTSFDDKPTTLQLGDEVYELNSKIGEGGFGAVFLMTDVAARDKVLDAQSVGSEDEDEDEDDLYACLVAVKVEAPSNTWEALLLDRIRNRLPESLRSSIISPKALYAYEDESFLVLDYSSQGTLLDVVNTAVKNRVSDGTPAVEEGVAAFFVTELLRVLEGLHTAGFLHGDLKIDNCLVRLEPLPRAPANLQWADQYDASGANGWSYKGVRLIDFGRAIDMSMYPAKEQQTFVADWPTDVRDCVEIREARPWSYQADYFGLASIAYCLLFGKYITTEVAASSSEGKRYKIGSQLKRVSAILFPSEADILAVLAD